MDLERRIFLKGNSDFKKNLPFCNGIIFLDEVTVKESWMFEGFVVFSGNNGLGRILFEGNYDLRRNLFKAKL